MKIAPLVDAKIVRTFPVSDCAYTRLTHAYLGWLVDWLVGSEFEHSKNEILHEKKAAIWGRGVLEALALARVRGNQLNRTQGADDFSESSAKGILAQSAQATRRSPQPLTSSNTGIKAAIS